MPITTSEAVGKNAERTVSVAGALNSLTFPLQSPHVFYCFGKPPCCVPQFTRGTAVARVVF